MKRFKHIALLLACSLSPIAYSQLVYEISGNGAAAKSYLLATNRLVDMQFLDTIPNVFKYFTRCNKVLTEFTMQDHEALSALRQAAVLPDSVRLRDRFTEAEYQWINDALLHTLQMSLDQLIRLKPSYLCELYRTEILRQRLDLNDERTMETFFELVAEEKKIPVYGLDNVGETMFMLFDREPFEQQLKDLKQVIDHPTKEVEQEKEIERLYRDGRLNDMVYQITSPDNTTSISYSDYQIYAARNEQWVKRLEPYLNEGKVFITLNAIYLGGDRGLISLLRAAGYKVKAANKSVVNKSQE